MQKLDIRVSMSNKVEMNKNFSVELFSMNNKGSLFFELLTHPSQ